MFTIESMDYRAALQDISYKFESISRYVETSPGGDRKAWFTIMMQAPNNAEPRPSDPRLTWMRGGC